MVVGDDADPLRHANTATADAPEDAATRPHWARLFVVHPRELTTFAWTDGDGLCVGRAPGDGGLELLHKTVSRRHFTIEPGAGRHFVGRDEGSHNGTSIDGIPATQTPRPLTDGSVLRFGDVLAIFEQGEGTPPELGSNSEEAAPGRSIAAARLRAEIARAARGDAPVLVVGDTGTGKEFVARELHRLGEQSGPLVVTNCAALSPTLVESQLFGHRKGAFTGAGAAYEGVFRAAEHGTLFLDEIGELPLDLQPKLLRAVELGEVTPLGDSTTVRVHTRVVAATNRDLRAEVERGHFRRDLFARLSMFCIAVPRLRERRADIVAWFDRLHRRWHEARNTQPWVAAELAPDAVQAILLHDWPENLRGLDHLVHALELEPGAPMVTLADLSEWVRAEPAEAPAGPSRPVKPAREQLLAALVSHAWNVQAVARVFGRDRRQIYRWIDAYGIEIER